MVLLLTAFRYDTPVHLKRTGQTEKLNALMLKIYLQEDISQERIAEIVVETGVNGQEITYA